MDCKFKVGDRVRLVRIDYTGLPQDTRDVLELLLNKKRVVKVDEIDEDGTPWVSFRLKDKETGRFVHHFLSLLPDEWEKVS